MFFPKLANMPFKDEKICKGFKYISIKFAQIDLLKFGKGWHQWNKACIEVGLRPRKLNILMKIKFVLFLDIVIFVFICVHFDV
jgi:hypothetical protein